jgi:glycosyltransferase involved in cell wall biosynthesis
MRIAYITAGAAGMYCGSCMHDNTLVAALIRQGHEALLVPTYTPIRTDEPDVSQGRVFFGGINVFLQQKLFFFRYTPWFLDRLLDAPRLLRWVSRFAVKTEAHSLGELTISMLQGAHGRQRKEVAKLVAWLRDEIKPEVVNLTNALIAGMVPDLKKALGVPVLCSLQGDDIYLEALPEPHRRRCLELIRQHCQQIDGFVCTCAAYADFMAEYFAIPRDRIHVVHPGISLKGHRPLTPQPPLPPRGEGVGGCGPLRSPSPRGGRGGWGVRGPSGGVRGEPFTIGYFARVCPEKGLHVLVEAFRLLREMPGAAPCRLQVGGWLGESNRPYFAEICKRIETWGLLDSFSYVDCPDHASKVRFLQEIDVLSVPTVYREPKGLYVLEALANGVPVVQPRHGSFPELIEATGGGLLVNPEDPADLARGLQQLRDDPALRRELGQRGQGVVHERFHDDRMSTDTLAIYSRYLS